MKNDGTMFGVSPAYFISRFGERFTAEQIAASLPDLAHAGFDAVQAEIFHPESVEAWRAGGATRVDRAAGDYGLSASQFVGHFLLHAFAGPEAIVSDWGIEETKQTVELVRRLRDCSILTVPIPALALSDPMHLSPAGNAALRARMVAKLGRMLRIAEQAGCRLALEIMPGGPWPGIHGFLSLCAELGSASLGYNFDTGHAWSCKEWVPGIPALAGARMLGTHLKDNHQHENLALAPGSGTIPWAPTLTAIAAAGYRGSWDLEFRCPAERAAEQYTRALGFIRPLVQSALAAASRP